MSATYAVIDLGSNTIKLSLLRVNYSQYKQILRKSLDIRISEGMHEADNEIQSDALDAAIRGIQELLLLAHESDPEKVIVVATSALREANNQQHCLEAIQELTGESVRILSGLEEAEFIAKGVLTDKALGDIGDDLFVADLGGGSLECARIKNGQIEDLVSLPLGAVRLSDRFFNDARGVISMAEMDALFEHAREVLLESGFDFQIPMPPIGSGGAFAVTRAVIAAGRGIDASVSPPLLLTKDMGHLLTVLAKLPVAKRAEMKSLPSNRADILPAALAVILALADLLGAENYLHSYHGVAYGLVVDAMKA